MTFLRVTLTETKTLDFFYQENISLLIGSESAEIEMKKWNQYMQVSFYFFFFR